MLYQIHQYEKIKHFIKEDLSYNTELDTGGFGDIDNLIIPEGPLITPTFPSPPSYPAPISPNCPSGR